MTDKNMRDDNIDIKLILKDSLFCVSLESKDCQFASENIVFSTVENDTTIFMEVRFDPFTGKLLAYRMNGSDEWILKDDVEDDNNDHAR